MSGALWGQALPATFGCQFDSLLRATEQKAKHFTEPRMMFCVDTDLIAVSASQRHVCQHMVLLAVRARWPVLCCFMSVGGRNGGDQVPGRGRPTVETRGGRCRAQGPLQGEVAARVERDTRSFCLRRPSEPVSPP